MRTLFRGALLSLSLFALVPGSAAAKPPEAGSKDDANQAREHYKRGTTLYDLNRFDEAVKEFEAAYEIKDDPVLLYNIAQSYRLASRYPEALRFYRNYLRRSPKAPNKAEVEQKIADMEKLIGEQNNQSPAIPPGGRPTPSTGTGTTSRPATGTTGTGTSGTATTGSTGTSGTTGTTGATGGTGTTATTEPEGEPDKPVTPPPPPPRPAPVKAKPVVASSPPSPGRGKLIAGIVIGVVGVAAVATGIVFGTMAMADADKQSKSPIYDPALAASGKSNQTIGLALDIAGGVLIAAGVGVAVWGATQKPEKARSSALPHNLQIAPSLGPSYAGGSVRLDF